MVSSGKPSHAWFPSLMQSNEEFEVETDRAGELPLPFWSETVRQVLVGQGQRFPQLSCTHILRI